MTTSRSTWIGQALEVFVVWARVLDSHRTFPFGELQLTRSQLEALFFIAHTDTPATPGALAEVLGVTRGAVTQLVAGLVDMGMVQRQPHPLDGRRRVLALSPASRTQVDGFERDLIFGLAPRFERLDDAELQALAVLLGKTKGTP